MYAHFSYPAQAFLDMFYAVEYAASRGEDRPAMTGIFCQVHNRHLRMVATDGHRMVVKNGAQLDRRFTAIIRRELITKCLPKPKKNKPVEGELDITIGEAKMGIRYGSREIAARLIEGPYPDYEKVIPETADNVLTVNREEFTDKLRSLIPFTIKLTRQIHFHLSPKGVKLTATSPEGETVETELDCTYKGEEFEVAFNGSYLLEILKHTESETVTVGLTGAMSAAIIKGMDESYFSLIMPILLE